MNMESLTTTAATQELQDEIALRCQLSPQTTAQIGPFGFVELEESWGDETTILNTARISTSNRRIQRVADMTQRDHDLLYHLLKHNHGTPFETVYCRWRVIAPIFVLRQWMRHRMGTFNEFSQRYRMPITACYQPDLAARSVDGWPVLTDDQIRRQDALLEQLHRFYQEEYAVACQRMEEAEQQGLIQTSDGEGGRNRYRGRARELLRNIMPVATYSDIYWTVNFRSLMNFLMLRRKPDAQYEIRLYADAVWQLFQQRLPLLSQVMERVLREGAQPS
ncbi:MAG: FAD-dependent thymidylate synthase [Magnetococcales bacterium]|nr:FAD-dependent thymidylate synthase [Magnetococcales bacterium]